MCRCVCGVADIRWAELLQSEVELSRCQNQKLHKEKKNHKQQGTIAVCRPKHSSATPHKRRQQDTEQQTRPGLCICRKAKRKKGTLVMHCSHRDTTA